MRGRDDKYEVDADRAWGWVGIAAVGLANVAAAVGLLAAISLAHGCQDADSGPLRPGYIAKVA